VLEVLEALRGEPGVSSGRTGAVRVGAKRPVTLPVTLPCRDDPLVNLPSDLPDGDLPDGDLPDNLPDADLQDGDLPCNLCDEI